MSEQEKWLENGFTDVDEAWEILLDILSSGQGMDFTEWHRKSINDFATEIPQEYRVPLWRAYTASIVCDRFINLEEVQAVKNALLGTEEITVSIE